MKRSILWLLALSITAPLSAWRETVALRYDEVGRLEEIVLPSGRTVTHTFGERAGHKRTAVDGLPVVGNTRYTPAGLAAELDLTTGFGSPGGIASNSFDALERLASRALQLADTNTPDYLAANHAYDAWGYLRSCRRDDPALRANLTYTYTVQGQLGSFGVDANRDGVAEDSATYAYDDAGNLTARDALIAAGLELPAHAAAYDLQNRHGGWTYDDDGRLLADDRYRYQYNSSGRLAAISTQAGELVAHYLYDTGGRRVRVLTDDTVTFFQRDSTGRLVSERVVDLETEEVTVREHVDHNGEPALTVTSDGGGTSYEHSFTDRLGNPAVRWQGSERARQEYAPYGQQILAGAAAHRGANGFTGHEDDATGLTYMQARFYDPEVGRFNRPDPAKGFIVDRPATYNRYLYAGSNPINFIDPDGLLQRDAQGRLKVKLGAAVKRTHKAVPGVTFVVRRATLYTDKGNPIEAFTVLEGGRLGPSRAGTIINTNNGKSVYYPDTDNPFCTDCHGVTFADAQFWIDNGQVEKILADDGYKEVKGGPEVGDVVVYREQDPDTGEWKVQHSATVKSLNKDGTINEVEGLGGLKTTVRSDKVGPGPGTAWQSPDAKVTVYRKK